MVEVRVRQLLTRSERTQKWLAGRIAGGKSAVDRLLRQERPITLELVEELATAFDLHPIEFLADTAQPIWRLEPDAEAFRSAARAKFLEQLERQVDDFRTRIRPALTQELLASVRGVSSALLDLEARLNALASDEVDLASITATTVWAEWVRQNTSDSAEAEALIAGLDRLKQLREDRDDG